MQRAALLLADLPVDREQPRASEIDVTVDECVYRADDRAADRLDLTLHIADLRIVVRRNANSNENDPWKSLLYLLLGIGLLVLYLETKYHFLPI